MGSLADVIKEISNGVNQAGQPVAIMFGTVKSMNPLVVNLDQRFDLTEDFLIVPESLTKFEIDLKHKHQTSGEDTQDALLNKIVIREGLKVNDGVILIRMQGGSRFLVADKVVST